MTATPQSRSMAVLMLILVTACTARAQTTAVRARDFLDSLGMNAHMGQGVDDPVQTAKALKYLGVREVRDRGVTQIKTAHRIYPELKVSLLAGRNGDVAAVISQAEQLAAVGALLAVEGPNEPNNWPVTYQGHRSGYKTTAKPIALYQQSLYKAVKADPKLAAIPVFASSEASGSEPNNVGLQFLTIPRGAGTLMPAGTRYADYANCHNYVVGNGQTRPVDNNAWGAENPNQQVLWDSMYGEYGITWHKHFKGYSKSQLLKLPKVTTETGWVTQNVPHRKNQHPLTESQQADLFMSLYLDAYKRGWSYTFIYMLHDDPQQGYWGVYHVDWTPKVSAVDIHNLTTILADKSSAFTPDAFFYSIPNKPATVHHMLMQKSNGQFNLAVWDERFTGGHDNVTVNLGTRLPLVKIFDPTQGTTAIRTLKNVSSINLTLSDHPVILQFRRRQPSGSAR